MFLFGLGLHSVYACGSIWRRSLGERQSVVGAASFEISISVAVVLDAYLFPVSLHFFLPTYALGSLFVVFASMSSGNGGDVSGGFDCVVLASIAL